MPSGKPAMGLPSFFPLTGAGVRCIMSAMVDIQFIADMLDLADRVSLSFGLSRGGRVTHNRENAQTVEDLKHRGPRDASKQHKDNRSLFDTRT